ncbi:hypothetical protein [Paenibacillus glacialis]|uniref:Uncharacterized protein n=1 Tax=Paenibacillus glacialis TaxID=494026 RepID=A0A168NQA3_9BACL|nr:hypothetical protein [Paenibacillus glacialis]OAB46025.1 hypothetical protein PGLA_01095 [Paenibacillus glacialis]
MPNNQNQNSRQKKVQDNFKTPNEKFNAEFAEENGQIQKPNKVQENYKTPNEKYNAEFESQN